MNKHYETSIEDFYSAYGTKYIHQLLVEQGSKILVRNITNLLEDDIKGYDYLISAVRAVVDSDSLSNPVDLSEIKDKGVKKQVLKLVEVFGVIRLNWALMEAREQIIQHQMGWEIYNTLWKISLKEVHSLLKIDENQPEKLNFHNIKNKELKEKFEAWGKEFGAKALRTRIKRCLPEIVDSRFNDLLAAKNMHLDPIEAFRLVEEELHEYEAKAAAPSKARE